LDLLSSHPQASWFPASSSLCCTLTNVSALGDSAKSHRPLTAAVKNILLSLGVLLPVIWEVWIISYLHNCQPHFFSLSANLQNRDLPQRPGKEKGTWKIQGVSHSQTDFEVFRTGKIKTDK